jgi:hypothetical protein
MPGKETTEILSEWRYYSETVKRILPGDTTRFRVASARLGYPLMNSIPGLVDRIEDLDRWLQSEQRLSARLTLQLSDTQKQVSLLNAQAESSARYIKALETRQQVAEEEAQKRAVIPHHIKCLQANQR